MFAVTPTRKVCVWESREKRTSRSGKFQTNWTWEPKGREFSLYLATRETHRT